VRVAGVVAFVRMGKAMEGALAYVDDGTGIVQCMVLYDQQRATAAQRLSQHVVSSQPLQGVWVECRGKIALKRQATGPLYEQFCLRLHSLHVHQDPYAELHHWQLLQQSRDILFPPKKGNAVPPVSLPVRVCDLLNEHVTLSFEQLCAHLSISAPLLRDTITEMMENGDIYLDNVTRTYRLL
jgi:hypothetical protein